MREVKVTELRNHLPQYLAYVQDGAEILITSRGQVIARILPPEDAKGTAVKHLKKLRKYSKIGDVISPINEDWDAEK